MRYSRATNFLLFSTSGPKRALPLFASSSLRSPLASCHFTSQATEGAKSKSARPIYALAKEDARAGLFDLFKPSEKRLKAEQEVRQAIEDFKRDMTEHVTKLSRTL